MGRIEFTAESTHLNDFRDMLRERGYRLRRQKIKGGALYAAADAHNWYGIVKAAEAYSVTLKITKQRGFLHHLKPYRLRLGVLAGLACGFLLLGYLQTHIHSIEIYGNTSISDTEILSVLEDLGIRHGARFQDLDLTLAERQMRLRINEIAWISMRHTGGRMVVELREETKPPACTSSRIPSHYIASVPAQITEMRVFDGEPQVKVGDAVRKGDVLISGIADDLRGVTRFHHADGCAIGIYEQEFTYFQPFCEEVVAEDAPKTAPFLEAFGHRFAMSIGFEQPAEPFRYAEEITPLKLFGRQTPFSFIRCQFFPQQAQIAAYSTDEIDAIFADRAALFEQYSHKDDKIISKEISTVPSDLGILLQIHYVFEGVVGEISEIFVNLS